MRTLVFGVSVLLVLVSVGRAADFEVPLGEVSDQDATHTQAPGKIAVSTGHATEYPGITLRPKDRPKDARTWDLSPYAALAVTLKNTSTVAIEVSARLDSTVTRDEKDEPHSMTRRIKLAPDQTDTLTITLERAAPANAPKLFGMRGAPPYAALQERKSGDPARVTSLVLFLTRPAGDRTFEVARIAATGAYTPPKIPNPVFPLIDTFGQHKHADWPGKTHSLEELTASRTAEEKDLAAHPGPAEWDAFGGWAKGPKLEATGWFRTQKVDGKWWLIDPEGRLFFSHGITCVRDGAETAIDGRENWFDDLPKRDGEFKSFWSARKGALMGYYQDKPGVQFNFAGANLYRRFGSVWKEKAIAESHTRLRSWGINTMGNWSDGEYTAKDKTPYAMPVHFERKPIEGSKGYWGKFPDPFDPGFSTSLKKAMANLGKPVGDPWCIGFFVDNELAWGDATALAISCLESPPAQPAKKAFVAWLKEQYGGIAKLNGAWGTSHGSWEALVEHRVAPDKGKASADLLAFNRRICDQYFSSCRDALKAAAPHQLYLGCRFAWTNDVAQKSSAEYCDIVSYNLYRRTIAGFAPAFSKDVPIMNTEWHLGGTDRGPFHPGLVPMAGQAERGRMYAQIVREHLAHPQMVGSHWFQYRDQPTTGRPLDGENYQIGFVDICDRPYEETVSAARDVGYRLYELRQAAK